MRLQRQRRDMSIENRLGITQSSGRSGMSFPRFDMPLLTELGKNPSVCGAIDMSRLWRWEPRPLWQAGQRAIRHHQRAPGQHKVHDPLAIAEFLWTASSYLRIAAN